VVGVVEAKGTMSGQRTVVSSDRLSVWLIVYTVLQGEEEVPIHGRLPEAADHRPGVGSGLDLALWAVRFWINSSGRLFSSAA
jgi:hypothetical protein